MVPQKKNHGRWEQVKIKTFVSVLGLLISTLGGRFPRAWLEPHAHTRGPRKAIFAFWGGLMWVGSALSQDVTHLADHP
ncbi:hypothetical protein [Tuberibacillus sp. Marseille-P3662]|uniref:hypothetical protein n=1 Tax=Tuberibacillus sp. Marseille-P3662 TaxID=1965358 RepID=UPI000A1CD16A|nr:hypothetical protein [Tuberibacillus sp. Marseille-P3662]